MVIREPRRCESLSACVQVVARWTIVEGLSLICFSRAFLGTWCVEIVTMSSNDENNFVDQIKRASDYIKAERDQERKSRLYDLALHLRRALERVAAEPRKAEKAKLMEEAEKIRDRLMSQIDGYKPKKQDKKEQEEGWGGCLILLIIALVVAGVLLL